MAFAKADQRRAGRQRKAYIADVSTAVWGDKDQRKELFRLLEKAARGE